MNNMEDIDKVMLDKLGGHSEEPPAGLFESVMFQREKEQRSLKTKRILLITGAVVLLAITAYVLYKNVYAAMLPEQNEQPVAVHFLPDVSSDNTGNQPSNTRITSWPDSRMSKHDANYDNLNSADNKTWFDSKNTTQLANLTSSKNQRHVSKSTPSKTTTNSMVNAPLQPKATKQESEKGNLSSLVRAFFTYRINNRGEVSFINESDAGKNAVYTWHFGDGSTFEGLHAQYEFTKNGIYHTCLSVTDQHGTYDSYCTDLYIDNLPEKRDIRGEVNLKNSVPDNAWVYLIRFDSVLMTPFLIDSTRTDETGHFVFKNKPQGYYILRGALDHKSKHYHEYLPTFYGQTLGWNMATRHSIGKESPLHHTIHIDLVPLKELSLGTSMIEGNTPNENEMLVLYDEKGNPVGFSFADQNGKFNFNNLPPGKYNVFNPQTGKFSSYTSYGSTPSTDQPLPPPSTTPDGNNNNGNSGDVAITTKDFTISPNPCRTYTTVKFDNPELCRARVSVININTNAEVYTFTVKNPQVKQEISIDVQYWAPGLYLITIDKGNGNIMSNKLLKNE